MCAIQPRFCTACHVRGFTLRAARPSCCGVRQRVLLQQPEAIDDEAVEKIVVELAGKLGKKVVDLTAAELEQDALGAVLLQQRTESVEALTRMVCNRLLGKIERGSQTLSARASSTPSRTTTT